jgi:hypothetical protein
MGGSSMSATFSLTSIVTSASGSGSRSGINLVGWDLKWDPLSVDLAEPHV